MASRLVRKSSINFANSEKIVYHKNMQILYDMFFAISEWIQFIGLTILIFGCVKILIQYFIIEWKSGKSPEFMNFLQDIRHDIGVYILLALDFLIIADIIMTISKPSTEEMIRLVVVIIIRTMIGFFLSKEIESATKSIKKTSLKKS